MPAYGGYTPGAERYGGSTPVVATIHAALNAARGTAYDVTESSPVWVENMAIARAIANVWNTNELLGNQFDPRRATVTLARWERIYGISPAPGATDADRCATLAALVERTGVNANYQEILDRLTAAVAPIPVSISHDTPSTSGVIINWPGNWYVQSSGTTPPALVAVGAVESDYNMIVRITGAGGLGVATYEVSFDGGTSYTISGITANFAGIGNGLTLEFASGTYATDNIYTFRPVVHGWSSTVCRIIVSFVKPSWMAENIYYDTVGRVHAILDSMLPAWVSYATVREGSVPGQFRLDEAANLDNQRMS